MQKIIATIAATIALATTAAAQEAPAHVTTIIIDTRAECGFGKIVDAKRKTAEQRADRLARQLRAEGKTVRVIRVDGRTLLGYQRGAPIFAPSC